MMMACFSSAIDFNMVCADVLASFTSSGSGSSCSWFSICFVSGEVMFLDAVYDCAAVWCRIRKPRPPSLIGRDRTSRSFGDTAVPNRAGISSCSITSSSGLRMSEMSGSVRRK